MRVLFDQGTPAPLRQFLQGHTVSTAAQKGCHQLQNGELLNAAGAAGFDVLVTTDLKPALSAEPWSPRYRNCGTEHPEVARCSIAHRKDYKGGKRCHARELCRSGHSHRMNWSDVRVPLVPL